MAREKESRRIIIETGSREAFELVRGGCAPHHPLASVVQEIREKMSVVGEIKIAHCFREGNIAANWLATAAVHASQEEQRLEEPPEGMKDILQNDMASKSSRRWTES